MPASKFSSSMYFDAFGTETHRRAYQREPSPNFFPRRTLEDEFESELNQPRICPGSRAGYDSEVLIISCAANGVGRGKLCSIEDIEKLRSKLEVEPVVGSKPRSLEEGEIEIVDSLCAQPGIHARLISESEIRRCRKTGGVEPSRCVQIIRISQSCSGGSGDRRSAAGHKVRTGTSAKKCGAVELSVGEDQRESPLKYGHPVDAPSPHNSFCRITNSREKLLALAEREIKDIAHHQALGNILRGKRTLSTQIVVILNSPDARLQPRSQRVGVTDEFRIGVRDQQRPGAREPSLHCELKRMIDAVV